MRTEAGGYRKVVFVSEYFRYRKMPLRMLLLLMEAIVIYLYVKIFYAINTLRILNIDKVKAVPLQARCGPQGSRSFRIPDFHDIRHMKVVRSSASHTGRLYLRKYSWYSFSLGAESIPGPWYGRKEICH
jgi:hypothetical protein